MKRTLTAIAAIVAAVVSLSSCNKNSASGTLFDALVTVKYEDGKCVLQVDDDTRVYPTNLQEGTGDETRALTELYSEVATSSLKDGQEVQVLAINPILTKKAAPIVIGKEYGNDPVMIVNDWLTVAEDGYVTLHIVTYQGSTGTSHIVEMISGLNPDDPYELEFRHDAQGDSEEKAVEGVVAFNVRDILPDTPGEVTFTVKYNSFDGPASTTLKAKVK